MSGHAVVEEQDPDRELVVLLDESGRPCGSAPKARVHHRHTPLHLAFSCWVFDSRGRVLITRRAWSKTTWPGVWTNAFCGHPLPDEPMSSALHRRARVELGLPITEPVVALPDFRYRAVMDNGIVENEICPVFVAEAAGNPDPNPDEVAELRWVDLAYLRDRIARDRRWFSPWAARQLDELAP
jgi:isopentenyl-diphosphate delta-isomerase